MAKRYIIGRLRKVRMADPDGEPDAENYLATTVYDNSGEMIETGILDAQGNPIMARYVMERIGFVHYSEE